MENNNILSGEYEKDLKEEVRPSAIKLHNESFASVENYFKKHQPVNKDVEVKAEEQEKAEEDDLDIVLLADFCHDSRFEKKARAVMMLDKSYRALFDKRELLEKSNETSENIDVVQAAEEDIHESIEKRFEEVAEEKPEEVAEEEHPEVNAEDNSEAKEEIDTQKMVSDAPARIDFFDQDGNPKQEQKSEEVVEKEAREIPLVVPERSVQSVQKEEAKEEIGNNVEDKETVVEDEAIEESSRITKIPEANFDQLTARIVQLQNDNKSLKQKVAAAENEVVKLKEKVGYEGEIVNKSEEQKASKLVLLQKYIDNLEGEKIALEQREEKANKSKSNLSEDLESMSKKSQANYDEIGAIDAFIAACENQGVNEEEEENVRAMAA